MTITVKAEEIDEALGLLKDAGLISIAPKDGPENLRAAIELLKVSALQGISLRLRRLEKLG